MQALAAMILAGCSAGGNTGTTTATTDSGTSAATSDAGTSGDATGTDAQEIEAISLKLGTTAPPTVQVSQSAAMFSEKLEEISGGKMTLDINYAGALGTTAQHYSQITGHGIME